MANQEFRVALTTTLPFSMNDAGTLAQIGAVLAKAKDDIQKRFGVDMQLAQSVVTRRAPKQRKEPELAPEPVRDPALDEALEG